MHGQAASASVGGPPAPESSPPGSKGPVSAPTAVDVGDSARTTGISTELEPVHTPHTMGPAAPPPPPLHPPLPGGSLSSHPLSSVPPAAPTPAPPLALPSPAAAVAHAVPHEEVKRKLVKAHVYSQEMGPPAWGGWDVMYGVLDLMKRPGGASYDLVIGTVGVLEPAIIQLARVPGELSLWLLPS